MTGSVVRFFLVMSFFFLAFSPRALAIGELVWSVQIEENTATLTANEFATASSKVSEMSFPVRNLRINRVTDLSKGKGESHRTRIFREVAPLFVNEDGTLPESTLAFLPPERMTEDPSGKTFAFLGLPDDDSARKASSLLPVSYVNLTQTRGQHILGWERSADGLYGIVHTEHATFFFDATATAPPGPRPVQNFYIRPTFASAMSDNPECVALVAKNGEQRKLVVFTLDSELVFEEDAFTSYYYDQLYLTPSGETLIVDRTLKGRDLETVAVDVANGSTKVLDAIVEGDRYYSRDGTRLVVIQSGYGKVFYYDSSNPYDPQVLWIRELDRPLVTAAVSRDGSYVALQTVNNSRQGQSRGVLVLDGQGNDFAEPLPVTQIEGLRFEEDILFVGTQRHPVPGGVHWETTTEIQAFNFAE